MSREVMLRMAWRSAFSSLLLCSSLLACSRHDAVRGADTDALPELEGRPLAGRLVGFAYAPSRPGDQLGADAPGVRDAIRAMGRHTGERQAVAAGAIIAATRDLLTGHLDGAIRQLVETLAEHPANPLVLADLAALYLEKADREQDPEYLAEAYVAAAGAQASDPAQAAAAFNRAMVLERL